MQWAKNKNGFTIVELLIVIVVIAILAAITIVAFNGVQQRAQASAVQSSLSQATKKVLAHSVTNTDDYPLNLAEVGITNGSGTTYQYLVNNEAQPKTFCITAAKGTTTFYQTSGSGAITSGRCPGYNLADWDETNTDVAAAPLDAPAERDTTVYRSGPASMKIPPSQSVVPLKSNPFLGTENQVFTISLWIKTDPNWNGSNTNSKIRIAKIDGTFITACSYNGIKVAWTKYVCNFIMPASLTGISLRLGNDGSIGNIWIDDLVVSRTD
jgi:prepilin-type N-terminal cleavage/methylation domain-containing protein